MKLIPLDTVLEVLTKVSTRSHIPNVIDAVMEIPTIDPIATIDEMIEEVNNPWKEWETKHKTEVLRQLKKKLYPNK